MLVIFGLTYFFSLLLAGVMMQFVIHQSSIPGLFVDVEKFGLTAAEGEAFVKDFMAKYGNIHRTFSHGAVHGGILAIMGIFPIIAINSLFERRGWKYIFVHTGYWFISLILMGGVICAFM